MEKARRTNCDLGGSLYIEIERLVLVPQKVFPWYYMYIQYVEPE